MPVTPLAPPHLTGFRLKNDPVERYVVTLTRRGYVVASFVSTTPVAEPSVSVKHEPGGRPGITKSHATVRNDEGRVLGTFHATTLNALRDKYAVSVHRVTL